MVHAHGVEILRKILLQRCFAQLESSSGSEGHGGVADGGPVALREGPGDGAGFFAEGGAKCDAVGAVSLKEAPSVILSKLFRLRKPRV